MKRFFLACSALCLTSCAGYRVAFGVGTEVNGVPVRVDIAVDRSKDAKDVQPVLP